MTVRDIAYVELYAKDKQSAVDYFVSALGFACVADSVGPDRSSVLLRQGAVHLIVTSGPATWKFLDNHGDGIADIAMTCEDVAAAWERAGRAGARLVSSTRGNPILSGCGDVTHTLLPAATDPATGLPPGHRWVTMAQRPGRPAERIRALDHIAFRLDGHDLEGQAAFYRAAFGFSQDSPAYGTSSIVVRSGTGGVTFTLAGSDPAESTGGLDTFLARNGGPGVQRVAFLVEDIVPAAREFRCGGVEFTGSAGVCHDTRADSLRLFSRSPYRRDTLLFEIVQRRGSGGFDSADIRALYEVMDHDRLAAG
ncbi:VOC family protein [Streptomyces sp. NPDC013161]|uniref:VOC family protein n=1 Tax=Streptomyces sp. NPDC013161 TaxID=3364862 RepID=UPI00369C4CD7